jgi:hypothetical protein
VSIWLSGCEFGDAIEVTLRLADLAKVLIILDRKGFGCKATRAGRKVYLFQYRLGGRAGKTQRVTIGTHGDKKVENLKAAVALHFAHYNLVIIRQHKTLRVSPAMAAGVENRLWSIEELVERALPSLP